jgi:uncharacterized protein
MANGRDMKSGNVLSKKRILWMLLWISAIFMMLVGIPAWMLSVQSQREARNEDLIIAAQMGQVAEVKSLLESGADPNARDLPIPEKKSIPELLAALLHGDHPADQTQYRTVLSCAMDSKHTYEIAKLLLDRGASVKADDATDDPALSRATRDGDMDTVTLLLDHGADVNKTEAGGFTPLAGAILADKSDLVKLLLDRGAKVPSLSPMIGTPLSIAKSPQVKALLRKAGATR